MISMAGRKWTPQEETQLRALVEANADLQEIATKLQRTPGSVIVKCERLGLKIQAEDYVKSYVHLPRELPSVEEALLMLAGALKGSLKPGLNRIEVQRLQAVATISKTYKELLVDYVNYREIETKLREMEELNAQLLKERSPSPPPQPNPPQMAGSQAEQPPAQANSQSQI
jgi:hypothetical protein